MFVSHVIRGGLNSKFLFLSLLCGENCQLLFGMTSGALRLQFISMPCMRFVDDLCMLKILMLCGRVVWKFFASYLNVAIRTLLPKRRT